MRIMLRTGYLPLCILMLFATTNVFSASGVKSHYINGIVPNMPTASEAQQMVDATPWLLRPFRLAHQQSVQLGMKSFTSMNELNRGPVSEAKE